AAMHVGDGLLLGRPAGGDLEMLIKPNRGEYVNETVFVTTPSPESHRQTLLRHQGFEFICASSDGIERLAVLYQDWTPPGPFFAPLEEYMLSRPNPQQGQEDVREYLERERLDSHTDDDRALVLCRFLPSMPTEIELPAVDSSRFTARTEIILPAVDE